MTYPRDDMKFTAHATPTPGPWRRDEYRDRLTGVLVGVEVVPEFDSREHESAESCECLPAVKERDGATMLIHNAFDGREVYEGEKGH